MIIFLTLLYIGVLFLLVRFRIVPWNTFWKISPVIWMVLLFTILFIPMNWGAPSGPILVIRQSVAIVPNVAGEVIDVPVQPNKPLKAGDVLFKIDPVPYEAKVRQIEAELKLAEINLDRARQLEERQAGTLATRQQRQAEVDSLRAGLSAAKWDLDKTVVRAPSDGFVTNVGLRKGARVAAFPVAAVMAFIETADTLVGVQVQQIYARHVAAGQPVELAFKFLPGKVYSGQVVALLPATSLGQTQASGSAIGNVNVQATPFVVRVALDNAAIAAQLPAGTTGTAAIYTASAKPTQIIRHVMMHMSAWLNYIIPF
jgi:RND family efflux transporter MFP subunit